MTIENATNSGAITITNAVNNGNIDVTANGATAGGIIGSSLATNSVVLIQGIENRGIVTMNRDTGTFFSDTPNERVCFSSSGGIVGEGRVVYFTGTTKQGLLIEKAENSAAIQGTDYYSITGGIISQITVRLLESSRSRSNLQNFTVKAEERNLTMPSRTLSMNARSATAKKILVSKVMNFGAVTTSGLEGSAGGIVGYADGNILNAVSIINAGNIGVIKADIAYGFAGGIIGFNITADMSKTHNYGLIDELSRYRGSMVGALTQTVSVDFYWLATTASSFYGLAGTYGNLTEGSTVISGTADQFKVQANFTTFDFDTIWEMKANASYPTLRP